MSGLRHVSRCLLLAVAAGLAVQSGSAAALERRKSRPGSDQQGPRRQFVPVSVSARHCHLAASDVARLFGPDHKLTPDRALSQPGQFACQETVTLVGPRGRLEQVRVLGPERRQTQVEITQTEARALGVGPVPVRLSGKLEGTPGVRLVGPAGSVDLPSGLIVAQRHLHASPKDARRLGVRDGQLMSIRVGGKKGVTFSGVKVRVSPESRLDLHLDTDEANAARISGPGKRRGLVIRK